MLEVGLKAGALDSWPQVKVGGQGRGRRGRAAAERKRTARSARRNEKRRSVFRRAVRASSLPLAPWPAAATAVRPAEMALKWSKLNRFGRFKALEALEKPNLSM